MILTYDSRTNNVKRFVEKMDKYKHVRVEEYESYMGEYVLVTYTDRFGEVPKATQDFLKLHSDKMLGVCSSGRQIWKFQGTYCKSADLIHEQYGVPILLKFEMAGEPNDIVLLQERIEMIDKTVDCP